MLTPSEALRLVLERVPLRSLEAAEERPLAEAAGRRLARAVHSDVDVPPFDKSMMDGYAVRSADVGRQGELRLTVVGESRAGVPFPGRVAAGQCVEIFTGAELPRGCDAVVMVERTRRDGDGVRFEGPVPAGQHVSPRGEILAVGGQVYPARHRLRPADLAVLATVGADPVAVLSRPRVSIWTSGDELVAPDRKPGPGCIREGNTLLLRAACEALGLEVAGSGIVPDVPGRLEEVFRTALERGDALITTGGVSVGRYDLVGRALEAVGVEPVLHKVAIKPGKPIWFGMAGDKPVFGLPGNPVSALLGFEVFCRPALARLAGGDASECRARRGRGVWRGERIRSGPRETNLPVRLEAEASGAVGLVPLPFRGSADLVSAARAEAFAVLPPATTVESGDPLDFRPLTG